LVAAGPHLSQVPERDRIARAIAAYVDEEAGGSLSRLAQRLGIHQQNVWSWRRGTSIPSLEMLLRISYQLGSSPLRFLTEERDVAIREDSASRGGIAPIPPRPLAARTKFDASGYRRVLEESLAQNEHPPPPLSEIARRLGEDPRNLYARFPELCRAISERNKNYKKRRGEQRVRDLHEGIRRATREIHGQGVYPGRTRVVELLERPGCLQDPSANRVWHETLRELGYEADEKR
jgi:transcriptional regulator with XRE-family HTH domain